FIVDHGLKSGLFSDLLGSADASNPVSLGIAAMWEHFGANGRTIRDNIAEAAAQAAEEARIAEMHGERPDAWEGFGPANVEVWRAMLVVGAGGRELRGLAYRDGPRRPV